MAISGQKELERELAQQARQEAELKRLAQLSAVDFSNFQDFDRYYDALPTADIKHLDATNASFRDRIAQDDANTISDIVKTKLINSFRALPDKAAQDAFYNRLALWQKKVLDADYNRFSALTSEQQEAELISGVVPIETPPIEIVKTVEEIATEEAAAAQQTEADRLAAEAAAQQAPPVVIDTEDLYDGIEKLGPGSYKLIVDPADGTPAEVFYGASQKDCFKALRKSKANATRELRRREKKVQITEELKGLKADIANYPFVRPVSLSPDEIFTLTEDRKRFRKQLDDPSEVVQATAKIREIEHKFYLASLTPEECKKINSETELRVAGEQSLIARQWLIANPDFYNCPLNINAMQELMGGLNWAVTVKNLDLAHQILIDQGVLLDRPEEDASQIPPTTQPAPVIPVVLAPVAPVAAVATVPVVSAPAAPVGVLPAPAKVLRQGSSSTAAMPTRRMESVSQAVPSVVLSVEDYHKMPASVLKQRYNHEPAFKIAVDKLMAEGKV